MTAAQPKDAIGHEGDEGREQGLATQQLALRGTPEQLGRAKQQAMEAADMLLLTDAPLLFPPAQLGLSAMRSGLRQVPAEPPSLPVNATFMADTLFTYHCPMRDLSGCCGQNASVRVR